MLSFTSDAKYKRSKMLYSHILRNLNHLRLKNKFCDLQLLTKDGEVYNMHKCVFVAACKRQFDIACSRDSDLPMTKLCKMILPDISSNELEAVISFIYGESVGDTHKPMLQEALKKLHMLDLLEELKTSETSQSILQNSASQTCQKNLDRDKGSEKSPQSTVMHTVSDASSMTPLSNENEYVEIKEEPVVEVEVNQPDKDPLSVSSDTLKLQTKEIDLTNKISEIRKRLYETDTTGCSRMNPETEKQKEISPQRNIILHNISSSIPLLSSQNESVEIKEEVVDEFQNSGKEPQSVSYDIQKQKIAETDVLNNILENDDGFNERNNNVAYDLQVDPEKEKETNSSLQNKIMQNRFNNASRHSFDMCNESRDVEFKEKPIVVEEVQSEKDTLSVSLDIPVLNLQSKDVNFVNNISDNNNRIDETYDSELTMLKLECEELIVNSEVISHEVKTEEDEKIEKLINQISDEVDLCKSLQPSQRTECATEIDIIAESSPKLHTWSEDCPAKTDAVSSLQIIDNHDNTAEHSLAKDSESIEIQTDVVKDFSSVVSHTVSMSACSSQQQVTSKMTPQSKYKMILPRVIPPSEFPTLSCLLSSAVPISKPGQTVKTSDNRNIPEKNIDHSYSSNRSNLSKCQSIINNPCHNTTNNSMSTEVMQHKTIATILALPPLIPNRITGTKRDIEARPECYTINTKATKNSDQAYLNGNQDNSSETDNKGREDEHTNEYREKPSVDIKLTTGKIMMTPNISEANPEPQREQGSLESSSQTLSCKLETVQKPSPGYKQKLTVKRNNGSRRKKKNDSNKAVVKIGISAPLQALLKETSKDADSSPVSKIPVVNHPEQQPVQEPAQSFSVFQNTQDIRTSSPLTLQTLLQETLKAVDSNPVPTTVTHLGQQTVQDPIQSVSTFQNNGSIRTQASHTPLQASVKNTSKDVDFSPVCTAFYHQEKQSLQAPTEFVSTLCANENIRMPSPLCDGNVGSSCDKNIRTPTDPKEVVGEKDDTVQGISRKLTLAEQIHLQRNRKNKRKLSKPMKRLSRETEVVFGKTESSLNEIGKPVNIVTVSLSKNDFDRERNENSVKCAQLLLNARLVQDETKKPVTSESEIYQESNTDKAVVDMSIIDTNSVFTPEIITQVTEHSSLSFREKKSISKQTDPNRLETFDVQSSIGKNSIGSISERSPEITKLLSRHTEDVPKFDFGVSKNVETTAVPKCQLDKPGKQQENLQTGQGLLPVHILVPEDNSVKHKTGNNVSTDMSYSFAKSTNTSVESEKVSEANFVNSKCLSELNKRRRNKAHVRRHESPVKSYMSVNQLLQIKPKLPENNSTKILVKCSSENLENKAVTVSSRKRQLSLPGGLERFNKSKRIEMKTNSRHRGKFGKTVDHTNEKKNANSCAQGSILYSNVGEPVTIGIKETSSNNAVAETVDNDFQNRKANSELVETAKNTNYQQPENIAQQTFIVISPSLQGVMKCYEKPLRFTPEQMVPSKYVEYNVTAPASVHKLPTEKLPQEKTLNKLKKSYPQPVRSYRPIAPKKTDDKSSS